MTLSGSDNARLEAQIKDFKAKSVPFAMATVVRTLNSTSAKPGGKALIDQSGEILMGWVGGGCARSAVSKAARQAIASGDPQFISLRPQELLESDGLTAGESRDGVQFERNGCPSKGTMDIFVEPVLPLPTLTIFGAGLVAKALEPLGEQFDFQVTIIDPKDTSSASTSGSTATDSDETSDNYIVVATQGSGDLAALRSAMTINASYVSFVGSRKKFAVLADKLVAEAPTLSGQIEKVHAPAGLPINAITPEEIALSILAQITQIRRAQLPGRGQTHV